MSAAWCCCGSREVTHSLTYIRSYQGITMGPDSLASSSSSSSPWQSPPSPRCVARRTTPCPNNIHTIGVRLTPRRARYRNVAAECGGTLVLRTHVRTIRRTRVRKCTYHHARRAHRHSPLVQSWGRWLWVLSLWAALPLYSLPYLLPFCRRSRRRRRRCCCCQCCQCCHLNWALR